MATVRIFTATGLVTAPVQTTRLSVDSVHMMRYPLLGRDLLNPSKVSADLSEASAAPAGTQIALVQVQQGSTVYFEVCPCNFGIVHASVTSPTLSGQTLLPWGEGWRLSVLEV